MNKFTGCQVDTFPVPPLWISSLEEIHYLRLIRILRPNHDTNELLLHCYCSAGSLSHVPPYITDSAGNATKNGTKIVEHNDNIREKAKHTRAHTQQGNINHFANMQHIKDSNYNETNLTRKKKGTLSISIKKEIQC